MNDVASDRLFGLTLAAMFIGILILNAASY